MRYFDVGVSILLALLNTMLCCVFIYAYRRLQRPFFAILAVASGLFVYANLFPAYLAVWPASAETFAASPLRTLYIAYTIVGPTGSILWFAGTILFIRAAFKSWSSSTQT